MPRKSSVLKVMLTSIFALGLFAYMKASIPLAELERNLAMIYETCESVLTGFVSNYASGLMLLP
jgi:hypothetical protein